jgi:hypothetical protein
MKEHKDITIDRINFQKWCHTRTILLLFFTIKDQTVKPCLLFLYPNITYHMNFCMRNMGGVNIG